MKKDDFSLLMDQVIERKLLPGNCAQEPKKQVRIMVRDAQFYILARVGNSRGNCRRSIR